MTAVDRAAAIRVRLEAATPGPWRPVDLRRQQGGQIRIFPDRGVYLANVIGRLSNAAADAELIAHAPEDLGHLLARVALLEAAVLRANAALNRLPWKGDGLRGFFDFLRDATDPRFRRVAAAQAREAIEAAATALDAETLGLLGREDSTHDRAGGTPRAPQARATDAGSSTSPEGPASVSTSPGGASQGERSGEGRPSAPPGNPEGGPA